LNRNAGS